MSDQPIDELIAELRGARFYTREHFPAGSPGKFIGRMPADKFYEGIDRLLDEVERLNNFVRQCKETNVRQSHRLLEIEDLKDEVERLRNYIEANAEEVDEIEGVNRTAWLTVAADGPVPSGWQEVGKGHIGEVGEHDICGDCVNLYIISPHGYAVGYDEGHSRP